MRDARDGHEDHGVHDAHDVQNEDHGVHDVQNEDHNAHDVQNEVHGGHGDYDERDDVSTVKSIPHHFIFWLPIPLSSSFQFFLLLSPNSLIPL